MSRSRLHVLGWGVVAATFCALLLASLAAGEARAGNCATMDFTFTLGSTNMCGQMTQLTESFSGIGLDILESSPGSIALRGWAEPPTGAGTGVLGRAESSSAGARGVEGDLPSATPGTGSGGVVGVSSSTNANGPAVWGLHVASGTAPGVLGSTTSTDAAAIGVEGTTGNGSGIGLVGLSSTGIGAVGYSGGIGVVGFNPNAGGLAGYFSGNVAITGTLTKGAGAFRIDHPLDPAHEYLQHSFVESPDMMNVYNGNLTTNAKGFATVTLPAYFQALNKDFRYQLTVVGRSFAQAIVWKQIRDNRFVIRTNEPKVKVSWQVTGIRHDPYANAHRIQTVVAKPAAEQGKYLHPELYGQPKSKGESPRVVRKEVAQVHR
jgi:hypothetical protein